MKGIWTLFVGEKIRNFLFDLWKPKGHLNNKIKNNVQLNKCQIVQWNKDKTCKPNQNNNCLYRFCQKLYISVANRANSLHSILSVPFMIMICSYTVAYNTYSRIHVIIDCWCRCLELTFVSFSTKFETQLTISMATFFLSLFFKQSELSLFFIFNMNMYVHKMGNCCSADWRYTWA